MIGAGVIVVGTYSSLKQIIHSFWFLNDVYTLSGCNHELYVVAILGRYCSEWIIDKTILWSGISFV
jgi:hypothetical protein